MYCEKCGHILIQKDCGIDGSIPYCPSCHEYKFPMFNSAISTVILNKNRDKILLIQQYDKKDNILVAGYINKGENAKEALIREVQEETGLKVIKYQYNDNEYFPKTNTLIHNYIAVVDNENYTLTNEVDKAQWFCIQEVLNVIKPHSLAKHFLKLALDKISQEMI